MSQSAFHPQLVALDIDGTVLDPDTQRVSAPVRTAIKRVVDSDAHLVVATGRSLLGTEPILDELDLSGGVALCSNGAITVDVASREVLSLETFDPKTVLDELTARLPGANYAAEQVGSKSLVTNPFRVEQLHGHQQLASLAEISEKPVPRLIAHWSGHTPEQARAALAGARLPCTVTIDHSDPWVTLVPEGVTKGSALEKLRVELGIPTEYTLAAGDGDNDIHMLRWAAYGVAMGQAPEPVRGAANEVTGTVAEDGLVTALSRWF